MALQLGLTHSEVDEIKEKNVKGDLCARLVLDAWLRKKGQNDNKKAELCQVLESAVREIDKDILLLASKWIKACIFKYEFYMDISILQIYADSVCQSQSVIKTKDVTFYIIYLICIKWSSCYIFQSLPFYLSQPFFL